MTAASPARLPTTPTASSTSPPADQLPGTLDRHYAGQDDLHLAAVDVAALGERLKWEPARGGDLFPHLYGALSLETVIAYSPLRRDPDRSIRLPVAG